MRVRFQSSVEPEPKQRMRRDLAFRRHDASKMVWWKVFPQPMIAFGFGVGERVIALVGRYPRNVLAEDGVNCFPAALAPVTHDEPLL